MWNLKKTLYPFLLKKLVFSPAMIVFITNVDISSRANFFHLKQTISPWYYITNVISTVIARSVISILMCNTCEWFYLGQTINLKQRIRKHKLDVFHPQNSFCKKCSEHLRDCSRMKEPFFSIYPFLYENKKELREFKEKRYIMRWKLQWNIYQ